MENTGHYSLSMYAFELLMGAYFTCYDPENTFKTYTVSCAFVRSAALVKLEHQGSNFIVDRFECQAGIQVP